MSIKSDLSAKTAPAASYAIGAPRSSDIISGALRRAFDAPADELGDFTALLGRIDHADRNRRAS